MSKRIYIPIDVPDKVALRKLKENACFQCPYRACRTNYDTKIRRGHAEFIFPLLERNYPDVDREYIRKMLDAYVAGFIDSGEDVIYQMNYAREVKNSQINFQ